MKKYLFILIILGLAIPIIAMAGDFSGPLVPCGREGQSMCTLCDLFTMVQTIVDFISLGITILAVVFITFGGFMILLAGANPGNLETGKKIITNAVIGVIIALLAWTVINMIFNTLVSKDSDKFPAPWNKIECVGGGVKEDEKDVVKEGEYCVCETPRYNLLTGSNDFSSATEVYTDINATNLTTLTECKEKCVVANYSQYCFKRIADLPADKYRFYCTDKPTIVDKKVYRLYLGDYNENISCRVGTTCYNSDDECQNAAKTIYRDQCFLDGKALCNSEFMNYSTYCVRADKKALCNNDASKYVLWKWAVEKPYNPSDQTEYNVYECSRDTGINSTYYCRLGYEYSKCTYGTSGSRCDEMVPKLGQTAPCSWDNNWTCQQGVSDQWSDACEDLKRLINCMDEKLPDGVIAISSISDNSPGSAALPGCFRAWTSQCKDSDSCTGTCCGHSQNSLHYGGETGTVDCRQCSWAVDFSTTFSDNKGHISQIIQSAKECADDPDTNIYGKAKGLCIKNKGNHIHIELQERAKYSKCTTSAQCSSDY